MRAWIVASLAVGTVGGVAAGAVATRPKQVKLPVYDKPVSFFDPKEQGIRLTELPKGVKTLSADECGSCHKREHEQWAASSHSAANSEPVFAAAFTAEQRFVCRSCHSPLIEQQPTLLTQMTQPPKVLFSGRLRPEQVAQHRLMVAQAQREQSVPQQLAAPSAGPGAIPAITEKNPHYDAKLSRQGINCVTCHVREGTILSSKPSGASNVPHALSYSPVLKKAEFCAGCHQFDIQNPSAHPFEKEFAGLRLGQTGPHSGPVAMSGAMPAGKALPVKLTPLEPDDPPVPQEPGRDMQYQLEPRIQHTFDEFKLSPAAMKGQSCQSCHMPAKAGGQSHEWAGRHSDEMLRQAVSMTARVDRPEYKTGDKLQALIELKNDAGHRFPTGDSIHAGVLDVWLMDGTKTLGRQHFVMIDRSAQSGQITQIFSGRQQLADGPPRNTVQRTAQQTVPQPLQQALQVEQSDLISVAPSSPAQSVGSGGATLEGPTRPDTRLLPGEQATLVYRQAVTPEMAKAKDLKLRVRVFHSSLHLGFRGSRIDPGQRTLRLIREQVLPVKIAG